MHTEHIIIWQKWLDPFGEDLDEYGDNTNERNQTIEHEWSDSDNYDGFGPAVDDKQNDYEQKRIKTTKVIATPMGIIPIDENTASGKIFNFWVGHTNFNITKLVSSIIEKTAGVECLDIFTRYRFRIAIGKAFNSSDVMKNIQDAVYQHISKTHYDDIK